MKSTTQISSLAACVSLAVAAPAAADIHIDATGHGGREGPSAVVARAVAKAATLGGRSRQGLPVLAQVAKGHRSVVVTATLVPRCENGAGFATVAFARAIVAKTGRFSVTKSVTTRFDDGYSVSERYKLIGKVTKAGARGSYRVDDTWFDPNGQKDDTCHTGTVGFRVSDAGVFAGTMNDGSPVVLQVSPGVDRVNSLLIPWTAECRSGGWMWDTADVSGPITAEGTFAGTLNPTLDLGEGRLARETQMLGGMVTESLVRGTWRVQASITDSTEAEIDACDTGPLTFKLF
ncbi:MAG: hypothetical protein ACJ77Z_02045 [Thermoleophilaceae bacterium]